MDFSSEHIVWTQAPALGYNYESGLLSKFSIAKLINLNHAFEKNKKVVESRKHLALSEAVKIPSLFQN